jgi:Leucine-rich repeat (LRR) protein
MILANLVLLFAASAALAQDPHVDAVTRIVEGAKGKVEKTADGQSLKLVDLAVPGAGPHDHRTEDPYDAAFFEHLGHVTTLESLNIIATKFSDDWMPAIAKLTNLKTLRFTNNGKLSDAGMEQLAGLKNLESFSFVGTAITGNAYAKFEGFTKLTRVSHRGSSINDEGLKQLCEHLPNLENLSLAHAKFSDAGAPNLAKLTKLKGLELGASKATPQALTGIQKLPLEYLQLGEGFEGPECIPLIKGIATLKRLTLTNAAKFSDAELTTVAGLTQLEHLELKAPFPDERLPVLKDFAFLKSMRLVPVKDPFTAETQEKIKALLPKTAIQFK